MPTTLDAESRNGQPAAVDLGEIQTWMSRATPQQKEAAIYQLLRDRLGPRLEDEYRVYGTDEFLYAHVISPGLRESWRLLEDPGLAEELRQASLLPGIPLRQIHEELGIDESQFR